MKQKRKNSLILLSIILLILSSCSLTSGRSIFTSTCDVSVDQLYRFSKDEIKDPKMRGLVDGSTFIIFDSVPQNYLDNVRCIVAEESKNRESGSFFITFYLKDRKSLVSIETNYEENFLATTELYPMEQFNKEEQLNMYYMRVVMYYPVDSMLRAFRTKKDTKTMVVDYKEGMVDGEFINIFMKALTNDQVFLSK
jgi:hypothetical protein